MIDGGKELEAVDSVKLLGVTISSSTSPFRYHSGSLLEIEHVTKIHEQIEIHLNGC